MSVFEFDFTYQPAAPSFQSQIRSPFAQTSVLSAMIDTGADATFVPQPILESLHVRKRSDAIVRSHWGEARVVPLYQVDFLIGIFDIQTVHVIGDSVGNEVILGRNILNRLVFLVDGIGTVTELKDTLT